MANKTGTGGNDNLSGTASADQLFGLAGNDILNGLAGNDSLNGGDGNDTLDGGIGIDTLIGGTGNDTYIVDNINDTVTESAGSGIDTVKSSVSYTLGSSLDNLTLQGSAINGTGNNLNNVIIGNAANNVLNGQAGNDTLNGGAGNDTLVGGDGNDILVANSGFDTFNGGAGSDIANYSSLSQAIALLPQGVISKGSLGTDSISNIERIVGAKGQANSINASSGTGGVSLAVNLIENNLIVNDIPGLGSISFTVENFVNVTGTVNDDTITGNNSNNVLNGIAGDDVIVAGLGNDILIGGNGNDTLVGGTGADTFSFNALGEGVDNIKDFNFQEEDKIQISASGFGIGKTEFDRFTFNNNVLSFDQTALSFLQPNSGFNVSLDIAIV